MNICSNEINDYADLKKFTKLVGAVSGFFVVYLFVFVLAYNYFQIVLPKESLYNFVYIETILILIAFSSLEIVWYYIYKTKKSLREK